MSLWGTSHAGSMRPSHDGGHMPFNAHEISASFVSRYNVLDPVPLSLCISRAFSILPFHVLCSSFIFIDLLQS